MNRWVTVVALGGAASACYGGAAIDAPAVVAAGQGTVIVGGQVLGTEHSSDVVQGSGQPATEERRIADFTELVVNVAAKVKVRVGSGPRLSIRADDNLLALIATDVDASTLTISARRSHVTRLGIYIDIETPRIEGVIVNGSGDVDLDSVSGDRIALKIAGSGDIRARGTVDALQAINSGSGEMALTQLEVETAHVTINGSGRAALSVAESLRATVNGSGDVTYVRQPRRLETQVRGSGKVLGPPE